jgi:hypothetical protein
MPMHDFEHGANITEPRYCSLTKIFSKIRSTWPREILRRQVSIFRCSLVTSTHGSVLYIHHGVVLILQPYALELRSNSSAQFLILHRVDSSLSTSSTPMKERDVFESNKHNFKSNTEDQNQSQEFNFFPAATVYFLCARLSFIGRHSFPVFVSDTMLRSCTPRVVGSISLRSCRQR